MIPFLSDFCPSCPPPPNGASIAERVFTMRLIVDVGVEGPLYIGLNHLGARWYDSDS